MDGTDAGTGRVNVTVRYFAGAKAAAGLSEETVEVRDRASVAGLIDALAERHGDRMAQVLAACTFLVDEVAGGPERPLPDGAKVDVLPPFAGG